MIISIKPLMDSQHITRYELAQIMGVTYPTINNIYKDMNITSEQTFTIPFKLSKKNGHIKILRNGETILDEDVNK